MIREVWEHTEKRRTGDAAISQEGRMEEESEEEVGEGRREEEDRTGQDRKSTKAPR